GRRQLHPAHGRDPPRLPDREGDRQARRGPAPRRLPRRRLRRRAGRDGGRRGDADRPRATPRQPGDDGRLRAPQGQLRDPDRARPGVSLHSGWPAAVLWDLDGTLVDTEPYWMAAERELVESFGSEWPEHHGHAIVGFDLLDAAAYLAEHGPVPLPPEEIVERML